MIKMSRKNISRYISTVVLISILTFGWSFASRRNCQANLGSARVLTDSAAALAVGGSEEACSPAGLVLIAIGMSGILGPTESIATIAAGILLLLGPCL